MTSAQILSVVQVNCLLDFFVFVYFMHGQTPYFQHLTYINKGHFLKDNILLN